ncbi:hypothetical protein [Flavobacterium sp.]
MKCKILLLFILLSHFCMSQSGSQKDVVTVLNNYLSLVKTEKGYVFTDDKGNKTIEYTYVYLKNYGMIETIIVPPIDPDKPIIKSVNRFHGNDYSIRVDFHVLDLMKELKIIDDYTFIPLQELTWANIRDGKISDIGCANKDGKVAMVSNNGTFLTDFKYSSLIEDDNKAIFNSYSDKGNIVVVVLDKYTGKEIFATKDSLVQYWNPENHIVKTKEAKYFLTYHSKKHKVTEEFSHVSGLPVNSSIFTYRDYLGKRSGFLDIKGKKVTPETELIPQTNFYNGRCLVLEIIKEEQKYNYYKEPLAREERRVFKLINERFETIKLLPEVTGVSSPFNKYGQCIVYGTQRDNSFVIDFYGNEIIPASMYANRITEINEGLYEVTDKTYPATNESRQQENFYNQKGEKVVSAQILEIINGFYFKSGLNENYLTMYGHKYITLSKDNTVLKSDY